MEATILSRNKKETRFSLTITLKWLMSFQKFIIAIQILDIG